MTHKSRRGDGPEERREPDVQALEARLAALRPREDRLDRDRLMYLAGQASAACDACTPPTKAGRWAWPASWGAVAGAAAALLVMTTLPPTASPDKKAYETINAEIAVRSAPAPGAEISAGRELMAGASLQDLRRWLSAEDADWPATDFAAASMGESVAETPILSTRSLDGVL